MDEVDRVYVAIGFVVLAGMVAVVGSLLDSANIDVWTGILTALVLLIISIPMFIRMSRIDDWPKMVSWLVAALVLKFVFSLIRYWFIFRLSGGNGDAGVYIEAAGEFAQRLRLGLPLHPLGRIANFPKESQYIGDVTGIVFYLTGASRYAAFMVFSWFCFMGQLLMVQALHVAVPEAHLRRYALLVMFLPSLLFWPSSVGKESLMILLLGFIFYGAAHLLGPRPNFFGLVPLGIGIGLSLMIRPHIAVMAIGSLAVALGVAFFGSQRQNASNAGLGRAARLLVLVGLVAVSGFAATRMGEAIGGTGSGDGTVSTRDQLAKAAEQTAIGNSAFDAVQVSNPVQIPLALVSVLFRPFPWEAGNMGALIAAAESAILSLIFLLSVYRIASAPRLLRRRPYLVFVLGFVVAFAIGFSYIGNFGILARQRVQMIPAVLVFVVLPAHARRRRDDDSDNEAAESIDEGRSTVVARFAAVPAPTDPIVTPEAVGSFRDTSPGLGWV